MLAGALAPYDTCGRKCFLLSFCLQRQRAQYEPASQPTPTLQKTLPGFLSFMFFPPRAPLNACPFPPPPQHFPDPQLQELRRARTKLLAEPSGDITAANQAAIKAGAGSVEEAK